MATPLTNLQLQKVSPLRRSRIVWMTCTCGARIVQTLAPGGPFKVLLAVSGEFLNAGSYLVMQAIEIIFADQSHSIVRGHITKEFQSG